jgi:hypothetical protein
VFKNLFHLHPARKKKTGQAVNEELSPHLPPAFRKASRSPDDTYQQRYNGQHDQDVN